MNAVKRSIDDKSRANSKQIKTRFNILLIIIVLCRLFKRGIKRFLLWSETPTKHSHFFRILQITPPTLSALQFWKLYIQGYTKILWISGMEPGLNSLSIEFYSVKTTFWYSHPFFVEHCNGDKKKKNRLFRLIGFDLAL